MSTILTDLARTNRIDPAERLRDQAAACRRLSSVAISPASAQSMIEVALGFESDARQIDEAAGA
jgi:hypothetical protein